MIKRIIIIAIAYAIGVLFGLMLDFGCVARADQPAAGGPACSMSPAATAPSNDSCANATGAKLSLAVRDADTAWIVRATLIGKDSTGTIGPVPNASIAVSVQRLFGRMSAADESAATTDETGSAEVIMPKDIPGNAHGMLTLVARVDDNDKTGPLEAHLEGKWGRAVIASADPFPRALWEPRAPIAMIITFSILFGGVWTTYGVILKQLVTIKKGKDHEA